MSYGVNRLGHLQKLRIVQSSWEDLWESAEQTGMPGVRYFRLLDAWLAEAPVKISYPDRLIIASEFGQLQKECAGVTA